MKLNWNDPAEDIYHTKQNEIYINIEDGPNRSQYKSKDNGQSWQRLFYHEYCNGINYISDDGNYLYFIADDSLDIFGVPYSSRLFKIHKDSTVMDSLIHIGCVSMNLCKDNFYFLQWGGIIRSDLSLLDSSRVLSITTGSQSFNAIVSDSAGTLYAGSTAYIGEGGLYKSYDNGDSWEGPGPDLLNDYIKAMCVDSEGRIFIGTTGHATLGTGRIYRSEDNGTSWEKVAGEGTYVNTMAINSDDEIFAGLSDDWGFLGIAYSKDHGDTWNFLNSGLIGAGAINDISISSDGYVYLATDGGVYRSVNSTTGIEQQDYIASNYVLYQNYPNPFNAVTEIRFAMPQDGNVSLNVFNTAGQLVSELLNSKMTAGVHSVSFNAEGLNSGIYYYMLNAGGKTETKKMLYLK